MDEVLLTPADVSRRLLISDSTVRRWLQQGRLKGFKAGGQWRIRYGDLSAFMHRRGNASANPGASDPARLFDRARVNPALPMMLLDLMSAVYGEGNHAAIADWQDLLKALEEGYLPAYDGLRSEPARRLVSAWRAGLQRLAA
jgi:excisionase family DNA binding protein